MDVVRGIGVVDVLYHPRDVELREPCERVLHQRYELELAAGTYKVTFVATGFSSQTSTVTIGSKNVKADWIDPAAAYGQRLHDRP